MMDCEIVFVGKDIDLLEECLNVRCAVFQVEKGIPREIDVDAFDCICEECEHFLIRCNDKGVGTVRCMLDFERKEVRLQRFCVCLDYRKFGFGRRMLEYLDVYYQDRGFEWIRLDSKFAVNGFYEKSGYRVVSDVFMEAGVEHVKMEKRIRKILTLDDLSFSNKQFWGGFFATSFPTALDEDTDMSLSEIIEENKVADVDWWDKFTKYYDGVLEEMDGYIDEPETVFCNLTDTQTLKIEFHPGDTVYYINDRQIACTGGEYNIWKFSFMDLLEYAKERNDKQIFLLLLPLTVIWKKDTNYAAEIISNILKEIFNECLCNRLAHSIVYGLVKSNDR